MPDADAAENAMAYLKPASLNKILPAVSWSVSFPVFRQVSAIRLFEKLNANLAKAVMSIGAVKGFEIGDGFDVAKATGKEQQRCFPHRSGWFCFQRNKSRRWYLGRHE